MDHKAWLSKPLRPSKIVVHDICPRQRQHNGIRRLEAQERLSSSFFQDVRESEMDKWFDDGKKGINCRSSGATPIEMQRLLLASDQFGWLQHFRLPSDALADTRCRWIHVSSKIPENLKGVFIGLSDWKDPASTLRASRRLDDCIRDNERFSKHGKHFMPHVQVLNETLLGSADQPPLFMSTPFLDWTVYPGPAPALRFQVDERESKLSQNGVSHPLRTLLQHYYRLEDTKDREKSQVFSRHKPWLTNRGLDLKVRQFYGYYPTGLNVDELWILVVDPQHIVTFSSNQTWKSRWPPHQLLSRIAEISLRQIRNLFYETDSHEKYTAYTHSAACLHAAIGLVNRNFWTDMPLPCTDRYSAHLSQLQYKLYRSPSTRLVMDLLQVQDELNIIQSIMKAQLGLLSTFDSILRANPSKKSLHNGRMDDSAATRTSWTSGPPHDSRFLPQVSHALPNYSRTASPSPSHADPHPDILTSFTVNDITEPEMSVLYSPSIAELLKREMDDINELQFNCNMLVNRTVQLVNIRLEDHGQAILVFTIVTIIFLPLSFVSSFFGMNVSDIRNMSANQSRFWLWGCVVTASVVVMSCFLAFYGAALRDRFILWRDQHAFDWPKMKPNYDLTRAIRRKAKEASTSFTVLDSRNTKGRDI